MRGYVLEGWSLAGELKGLYGSFLYCAHDCFFFYQNSWLNCTSASLFPRANFLQETAIRVYAANQWILFHSQNSFLLFYDRAYCVFIGSVKFDGINKVWFKRSIKFDWIVSYLKRVSHIINVPRSLGLYGENIGPPGLGSRDRAASSHTVNKIYRQTIQHHW